MASAFRMASLFFLPNFQIPYFIGVLYIPTIIYLIAVFVIYLAG